MAKLVSQTMPARVPQCPALSIAGLLVFAFVSGCGGSRASPATTPHCAESAFRRFASGLGKGAGRDGVYAVFEAGRGVLEYADMRGTLEGKMLWAVAPSRSGRIVITGHQVNSAYRLRFSLSGAAPTTTAVLVAHTQSSWQTWPSATILNGSGCYVFSVRGPGADRIYGASANETLVRPHPFSARRHIT